MTFEDREKIFAKESLNIKDLERLFDISYNSARLMMQNIRLAFPHPENSVPSGQCLVDDYIQYFGIKRTDRYSKRLNDKSADHGKTGITKEDLRPHYFSVMNGK